LPSLSASTATGSSRIPNPKGTLRASARGPAGGLPITLIVTVEVLLGTH
jgi:hypothetical protein